MSDEIICISGGNYDSAINWNLHVKLFDNTHWVSLKINEVVPGNVIKCENSIRVVTTVSVVNRNLIDNKETYYDLKGVCNNVHYGMRYYDHEKVNVWSESLKDYQSCK